MFELFSVNENYTLCLAVVCACMCPIVVFISHDSYAKRGLIFQCLGAVVG